MPGCANGIWMGHRQQHHRWHRHHPVLKQRLSVLPKEEAARSNIRERRILMHHINSPAHVIFCVILSFRFLFLFPYPVRTTLSQLRMSWWCVYKIFRLRCFFSLSAVGMHAYRCWIRTKRSTLTTFAAIMSSKAAESSGTATKGRMRTEGSSSLSAALRFWVGIPGTQSRSSRWFRCGTF